MKPKPVTSDDRLRVLIAEVSDTCAAMMAPVRERIIRRVQSAYWLGVSDGLDCDAPAPSADRRKRKR